MSFLDILKTVYFNLRANKGRSILSILGIVIGIASVIIIISAGAGAQGLILNQIKSVGSNVISIMPGKADEKGPPVSVMGIVVTSLTRDDAIAIKKELPQVESAFGSVRGSATVKYDEKSTDTTFVGVSASYPDARDAKVASGRFFAEEEEDGMAKTAQKLLLGINHVNAIIVKINDAGYLDRVKLEIADLLRNRHKIESAADDDFTIRDPQQALDALTTVTDALKFFLAGIAAISLLVGGIGIMNIMLISVTERTREIGLRKALGATNKGILFQFLLETVIVSSIGGILGIIIGIITTFLVAVIARYLGYDWNFIISILSIILAVSVSAIVGLVFGLWPAYQAAKKEPIEALRYE